MWVGDVNRVAGYPGPGQPGRRDGGTWWLRVGIDRRRSLDLGVAVGNRTWCALVLFRLMHLGAGMSGMSIFDLVSSPLKTRQQV